MPKISRAFIYVALVSLLQHTSWSTISIVLVFYAQSLGASTTMVGTLWSILSLGRLFAENPAGILVEKRGKKFAILLGLGTILISYLVFLSAQSVELLFIAISMTGIGFVLATMGARVYIAEIAPPEMRANYMGIYQGVTMSAGIYAPTIGGFVADTYGLKAPFLISFAVTGAALVLALIKIKEPPKVLRSSIETKSIVKNYTEILGNKVFLSLFTISLVSHFVMRFDTVVLPMYLDRVLHLSIMQISLISSIASISATIARFSPLIPFLERRVSRRAVLSIGYVLRGTMVFSFLFASNFYTMMILRAGIQFINGITRAFDEALLIDLTTGEGRAIVYGLRSSFMDVGGIFGPTVLTSLMNIGIRFPIYLVTLAILGNALLYFVTLGYAARRNYDKDNSSRRSYP